MPANDLTPGQRLRGGVRTLRRLIEWLVYGLFDAVVLARAPRVTRNHAKMAIVHLQLMGDYFVWLPYGRTLVQHLLGQDRQLTLVCNRAWAELARAHFPECEVLAVDVQTLLGNWRARAHTLRALRALGVAETACIPYPRDRIMHDAIVAALAAPVATAHFATYPDRPALDAHCSRSLYTRLVHGPAEAHQALQHEALLAAMGVIQKPVSAPLATRPTRLAALLGDAPYLMLSPGASRAEKMWPEERFIEIARRALAVHLGLACVLVGAEAERPMIERMQQALGPRCMSLAGRISLPELEACIRHACAVVGNDSAAGHIAAYCGVPSVVVLNGAAYGTSYPYPSELLSTFPVLPRSVAHPMPCFGCQWICRYSLAPGQAFPCVEAVEVDAVWQALSALLPAA